MKNYFDDRLPDAPWIGDPDGYFEDRTRYGEDYENYCAEECDRKWKEEQEEGGNEQWTR